MLRRTSSYRVPHPDIGKPVTEPWSEIVGLVHREVGPWEAQVLTWIYLDGRTTRQAAALAAVEVSELCAMLNRVYHHLAVRVLL